MRRRDFFAVLGGGILVFIADDSDAQESGGGARRGQNQSAPSELAAWLHIGENGRVTVYTGKVEVGQNARTSLTQAVAEELRAPVASIDMVMGDTAATPFDMGTFGSQTTPRMWPQIRKAAAAAREMLLDLAAQQWSVDRAAIQVANGKLTAGAHTAAFGELTKGQKLTQTIPSSVALLPATQWKVAGTSVAKVGARDMVTGAHKYAYDVKRPAMLYGKILYPPSFGATLQSLDSAAAEMIPGVTVVRDGDFAGVTATDPFTADKALAALKPSWQQPAAETSAREVYAHFKRTAENRPPAGGTKPTTYNIAYIAHVPLEPRAAVAEWEGNKLTVWTGTQRPFGVRSELSNHFRIPEDQVRVVMPDTGSGYGGKHTGDAAMEAARLAKAVNKPVKRNWTREEEMTWAYFRPGGVIDVAAKVDPDGTIAEWEFHNYNSGNSGLQSPYALAQKTEQFHNSKSPLRQGSYRGLAATANHFARESYMDELATAAKLDPLEFRLKNTKDERLRGVIEAVSGKFGWQKRQKTPGRGFGIAAGFEKGGYVATCAEVMVTNGIVKVIRVVEAFECGAIVNPEHLRQQVEGAVAQGIGGALFEQIDFADNKIANARLSRYRVPRFADMPIIESILLDRKDLPSAGAGETPIVGVAPAIANAIFDAIGKRIRSLPLAPRGEVG
jgi:nicotinate dehydrogenase subunit B